MRLGFSSWLVLFLLATNHVYGFLSLQKIHLMVMALHNA
jgi:hypothetical protein